MRCWWTLPRTETRQYLVDAAEHMAADDDRARCWRSSRWPTLRRPGRRCWSASRASACTTSPIPSPRCTSDRRRRRRATWTAGARFLARAVERLREQGRLGMLTQALVHYAWAATYSGDWRAAAAAGRRGGAAGTRHPPAAVRPHRSADRRARRRRCAGSRRDLEPMIARPERTLLAMKSGPMLAPAHLARGGGRTRRGPQRRRLPPPVAGLRRSRPELPSLHALVGGARPRRSGRPQRSTPRWSRAVVADLEAIGARSRPPILIAALACAQTAAGRRRRSRARCSPTALGQDLASIRFPARADAALVRSWLRRRRRGAESRAPCADAVELFDALGATRWSERARQELRATGETHRPAHARRPRPPHRPGAPDRPARRRRAVEPRDRRAAVPVAPHDRLTPVPDLPQARDHRAGPAARRARAPMTSDNQSVDSRERGRRKSAIAAASHQPRSSNE